MAKTPEEIKAEEEAAAKAKAEEEARIKAEEEAKKKAEEEAKKEIDPLAVGVKFKKVGDFVVAADFDPTLSPEYKKLNNQHIQDINKAEADRISLEGKIEELNKKLSGKTDLETEDRKKIEDQLSEMKTTVEIARKEAESSRIDLLKMQTASVLGLPHAFVEYVKGKTPEEIETSVKKVMADFKIQENKFSQEELDTRTKAAAEKAAAETEAALKERGNPTEGADGEDHIYTRAEIRAMSVDEFNTHKAKIKEQEQKGLIK